MQSTHLTAAVSHEPQTALNRPCITTQEHITLVGNLQHTVNQHQISVLTKAQNDQINGHNSQHLTHQTHHLNHQTSSIPEQVQVTNPHDNLLTPLTQDQPLPENSNNNTSPSNSNGNAAGYTCGLVCSKVFKTTDELTKHFLQDHVENYTTALKSAGSVGANQENNTKRFSGNTLMSNLLAMASGQQIKPVNKDSTRLLGKTYDCDVCNKKFGRLADLSRHLLVHSGVKPYRCQMCEKAYRNSGDLKTHMNMHAGIRPYGCAVCQRSFTARGVLARHMRTHTGERPYSCFVCAKAFADRRSRHDHILTHTGEKPHQCSICGKNFLQSSTLRTHVKTQHAALSAIKQDVHAEAMGALKPDLQEADISDIKHELLSPGIPQPSQQNPIQTPKTPQHHSQLLQHTPSDMTNNGPHSLSVTV